MKDVWLHIGLPKTATTTLQKDLFEFGDGRWWTYGGVLQTRRERTQPLIHHFLWDTIFAPREWEKHALQLAGEVDALTRRNLPLLLSEECATVDAGVPWQEKLSRLSWALRDYRVHILVGVREPLSALKSLYVERYQEIRSDFPSIDDFIERSNEARVFLYEELFQVLDQEFEPERTHLLRMESLGTPGWRSFWTRHFGFPADQKVDFGKSNSTTKGRGFAMTHPTSLGNYLNREVAAKFAQRFPRQNPAYRIARQVYRFLNVRSWNTELLRPRYSVSTALARHHAGVALSASCLSDRLKIRDNAC